MGRAYLGKRDYIEALDKFEALVGGFPDSPLRPDAMFYAGVAYYGLARDEEGQQAFSRLLAEYPDYRRRDEMLMTQAESLVRLGKKDEAIAAYRRIVDDYPDSPRRNEILFDVGELYMDSGDFQSAYASYDEVMRSADAMEVRLDARERRADALYREGRVEEALDTYRAVLDLGTDLGPERRAPVAIKIASCVDELGDPQQAIINYELVKETYPGTAYDVEATFRVAYIYERRFRDYAKALEVYDSIRQIRGTGARSIYADQSQSQAGRLRRLLDAGGGTTDVGSNSVAEAEILLAEQYFFQEEDTLRAIEQYQKVEVDYPGTGFAAKAAYARAWIAAEQGDPTDVGQHIRILRLYPGTPQALSAADFLESRGLADMIPEGALESAAAPDTTGGAPGALVAVGAGVVGVAALAGAGEAGGAPGASPAGSNGIPGQGGAIAGPPGGPEGTPEGGVIVAGVGRRTAGADSVNWAAGSDSLTWSSVRDTIAWSSRRRAAGGSTSGSDTSAWDGPDSLGLAARDSLGRSPDEAP